MRPSRPGAVLTGFATIVAGLGFAASTALAQFPVRIRVVDQETQRPLGGALVSAVGGPAVGTTTQAVLAAGDGTALLRVPATGVYRILVRRIGYAPFTSDTVRVTGNASVAITLAVPPVRIALAVVRVTARRECDADAPSTSSESGPVWEEVRKALETSVLSRGTAFIVTSGVSIRRTFGEDGKLVTEDTTAKGTAGARPFTAVDPALLERGGYVQGGYRTTLTFNAPDEQVLLSDGFRRLHCLSMAPGVRRSGDTTLIGLAFEPRTNNQLAEIRGTLWVDSATSELRRLEYAYVRAPLPFTVPGLGGFVDFRRHQAGAWYVSAWSIRMPRWRPSTMDRSGIALAGFSEVGGVATVVRESAGLPAGTVRTVTGSVFDSLSGRDMPGAIVRIPALGRETTADFLGRFRFDSVTMGIWEVAVEYPPLATTGLVQVEGTVDVVDVPRADLVLAVPSLRTLWRRFCPARPVPEGSGGFVSGTVHDPARNPIANAAVEFSWRQPPRDSTVRLRLYTDPAGRYVACVGSGAGVTVRAERDSSAMSSVPVTFAFVPARHATRDVVIASDEEANGIRVDSTRIVDAVGRDAGGVVDGAVKDPGGRPIVTARVRLLDVAGEARVTGRGGEFAYRGVPPGQHVVSIEAIGYERVRRVVLVQAGDSAHMDVRLGRLSTLKAVAVTERERVNALRVDITARVVAGHGYTVDSLKLAKVAQVYQAFNVPQTRLKIQGSRFVVQVRQLGFTISKTNPDSWCVPAVYIDDAPAGFDQLSDVPKENIALIEFYNRVANAPLRYTGTGSLGSYSTTSPSAAGAGERVGVVQSACGVVLVWTKAFLRVADLVGKPEPKRP